MKSLYITLKNHSMQPVNRGQMIIGKLFIYLLMFISVPMLSYGQITRTQMINNAAPYTSYTWTASSCNLWTGTSCGGRNVYRAPWVVIGSNTAMPYMWGGWSTTSQHTTAMANCKSAGDVCSLSGGGCSGNGSGLNQQCASGHDCSGLVSRAWALSNKEATTTLPGLSTTIPLSQVQPGDILNVVGSHTRLVETNYGNGNYRVIEASGTDWKAAYHTYTAAQLSSYDPRCPNSSIVVGGCGSCTAPSNDVCSTNVPQLTVSPTCSNTPGDIGCATQSYPASGCPSGLIQDVWYKFTATSTTTYTVRLSPSSGMDGVVEVRQGSCTGTVLGCADVGGGNGAVENLNVGVTNGITYYIRIYEYNPPGNTTPPATTSFNICVIGAAGLPDLSITAGTQNVVPSTVNAGSSVNASCSEDNSGNATAGANHVTLWLSSDNILNTSNDVFLGQIPFPSLPPGTNSTIQSASVQIPANTCSGSYYLFFWADGNLAVTESNENNNFATRIITVNSNFNAGTVSGTSPLCVGATATYTSNGTAGGTWSSLNTTVAMVNASSGLVTAVSAGTTNITYTVGIACGSPVSSSKSLTVSPSVNAGTVNGTSPLCVGATTTYTSNGTAGGTWSSSNTTVATVNASTGLVTAINAGTTNITYTVNSGCGSPVSSVKSLTVSANVNAGTVSGTSPICVGAIATYTSNGTTGGTWSSSNTTVATVNASTGLVTALSAGTTNITYTVNSGCGSPVSSVKSLTVSANVNPGTVSGTSPLCVGATATYSSNGTAGGTWSSSNTTVATVNASTGLVTAASAGTTNIVYTVIGCNATPLSASKTLTVNPNVNGGTVSGTSPLCMGAIATYTSNGTAGGIWSSSNTTVATVNASSGLVTAVSAGTTNITYTINSGCGSPVSSIKSLTVSANVNAGTVSGTSPLCVGATATYTSNGTAGGTWSSSNTSVATVIASSGFVTAVSAGTTNITYTIVSGCGGPVSSSKSLTVSANISVGTVSGTSPLCVGFTSTYTSNGTAGGTWSSSNTTVASVNAGTGFVTAVSAGTTNIVYTVIDCNGNPLSASKTLTVNSNVNGGTVSGTSPLCVGATATYTSNGTAGGTWSSSNTSVATVNVSNGLVTAVNAGTTNITYTINSGCGSPISSVKPLTVSSNVSAGTVSGTSPLCVGSTATYTSNGTAGGTWSSSNTSVATVNANSGLVTAIDAGTTNIIYSVTACNGTPLNVIKALTVTTNVSPNITISQTSCSGNLVGFNSSITNGGSFPAYLWSFAGAGTPISGITSSTFTLSNASNGTQVQCMLSSGAVCASPVQVTSAPLIINCIVTGVSNINGLEEFKVMPNPNEGLFFIRIKLNTIKKVSFRLYNLTGQIIYQSEVYSIFGTQTKGVDGSKLPSGLYLLETTFDRDLLVQKVMILRQ